jgi:integrase
MSQSALGRVPMVQRKYQLTWFPPRSCWSKWYKGKRYYVPTKCRGKSDRQGYAASLQWWAGKRAEIDAESIAGDATLENLPSHFPRFATDFHSLRDDLRVDSPIPPNMADPTVNGLIDAYLDARRCEAEAGQFGHKMYSEHKYCINEFRKFAEFYGVVNIDECDGRFLEQYRLQEIKLASVKKSEGGISAVTAKKRLQIAKRFFEWLEDVEALVRVPKAIGKRKYASVKAKQEEVEKGPETFTSDEIDKLWGVAPSRIRLYISLGLNCGYKQADIASLTHEMIDWESGFITRFRHKRPAPQIHKLWPVTLRLLEQEKSKGNGKGTLLRSESGNTLLTQRIEVDGGYTEINVVGLAMTRLKRKLQVELQGELKGKGFATFRSTSASHFEDENPTLTSIFLAHTETKTKRYYVSRELERLKKSTRYQEMFAATDELQSVYGLK